MRNIVKLAAAGLVLSAGLAAPAAYADVVAATTGNGELVLYATYTDSTGNSFAYARGTGVQIDAVTGGSKTALAADTGYVQGTAPNLGMSFATLTHDANLTTFLANAASAGAQVTYGIIGGDSTNLPTNRAPGSIRYGVTSPNNYSGGVNITNGILSGSWANTNGLQDAVNLAINSGATLDKSSTLNGQYGVGTFAAAPDMFGTGFQNAANVGSSQTFYLLTGGGGLATGVARVYTVGTFTLNAAGDLSFVSATTSVPLPAAVWLFGSGLLGLAGVGRRKLAA